MIQWKEVNIKKDINVNVEMIVVKLKIFLFIAITKWLHFRSFQVSRAPPSPISFRLASQFRRCRSSVRARTASYLTALH